MPLPLYSPTCLKCGSSFCDERLPSVVVAGQFYTECHAKALWLRSVVKENGSVRDSNFILQVLRFCSVLRKEVAVIEKLDSQLANLSVIQPKTLR